MKSNFDLQGHSTHSSFRALVRKSVNAVLAPMELEVKRRERHDWGDTKTFIPFEETIEAAKAHGLSVGDYIDTISGNIPGTTQATIDGMERLGIFAGMIGSILEIGPGSGRYLEKTLAKCTPTRYEIYETAAPWRRYVQDNYPVIAQPTDGKSLKPTADASIDLFQAHKVFSGVNAAVTCAYWLEALRVLKPGGHLVFDVITENCFSETEINFWGASNFTVSAYPALMPRETVVRFFNSHDFKLIGSFQVPLSKCGSTEVFVFRNAP